MADTHKEADSLGEGDVPAGKLGGAGIRYGVCAVFLAVFAAATPAQSEPIRSAQDDARSGPDALPPGEYPNHLFKSPFPPPTAEESKELDDKYLFGDWLGYRSQLAAQGIKPALLLLVDPFGNVTGGRRRGITEYGLFGLDVILETGKLLGWPGGQFRAGFAYSSGTSLSMRYVGNNFPIQLADVATPGPRLTYLSYTQSMLDDKLSIRFGRLTINSVYGEEFLASEYFKAFNSVGFDLVP